MAATVDHHAGAGARFALVTGSISLIVDSVTLFGWLFTGRIFQTTPTSTVTLPTGMAVSADAITYIVLMYVLIVFGLLAIKYRSAMLGLVATFALLMLVVWSYVFRHVSGSAAMAVAILWANCWFAAVAKMIFGEPTTDYDDTWLLGFYVPAVKWLAVGSLLVLPIAIGYVHEAFGTTWSVAVMGGAILAAVPTLLTNKLVLGLVALGVVAYILGVLNSPQA